MSDEKKEQSSVQQRALLSELMWALGSAQGTALMLAPWWALLMVSAMTALSVLVLVRPMAEV